MVNAYYYDNIFTALAVGNILYLHLSRHDLLSGKPSQKEEKSISDKSNGAKAASLKKPNVKPLEPSKDEDDESDDDDESDEDEDSDDESDEVV